MRNFFRNIYLFYFGNLKKPSNSIHILNGHYINSISTKNDLLIFEKLLISLSKKFTFLRFEIACNQIESKQLFDKPYLCFSFDDGYSECFEIIAPLLEKFNTNACFFINPSVINTKETKQIKFIENNLKVNLNKSFMTWSQIEGLHKRGHIIGNHTWSHKALIGLTREETYTEILKGKEFLEKLLVYNCKYFALPFGTPEYFDMTGVNVASEIHDYVFTSSFEYEKYNYQYLRNVFSRRHFEGNWPISHILYFLSLKRNYN